MQKKLIAAAVAGLIAVPALAQTNVTISGRFAAGYENYRLSGGTGGITGYESEARVSDQSSRIIFNVTEDLGGGLKAWGQLDSRFSQDIGGNSGPPPLAGGKAAGAVGNTWASGNTGMGLMHASWGKFTIGRWDVHYNELAKLEATRAGSLQSIVSFGLMSQVTRDPSAVAGGANTTVGKGTRSDNLIMWDSPNWNGFTGRIGYSTNMAGNEGNTNAAAGVAGAGNPGGGRMWTGALRYDNGPWTTGISYWNHDSESRVAGAPRLDTRSTRAWLGYTFGMGLKLGIAWDRSSSNDAANGAVGAANAGGASRNAWMIPVSYSFGPHAVYFNYARAGGISGSNVAPGLGGGTGANQWMAGYDYAFSKRTSAGVYYTKLNNGSRAAYDMFGLGANGATQTLRGEDARQWYFGLAHNF